MMEKMSLIEGLSTLTTIEESALERLVKLSECIIVDEVVEGIKQEKDIIDIDIGIGTLFINFTGDALKFKFAPNAKFEEEIIKACVHKVNLLDNRVEATLKAKIVNTYKDLL